MNNSSNKPLPLAGLRVLDIASLYAAPLAATILADFGAEVIKIEPPGGDGFRGTFMWPVVARNKKSIVLDLRQPEGCEVLRDLIEKTDVLIENYPAAVLEKRGIAWKDLSARNPRLVMVSISCFGQRGPYATRPGSGTIGEGFAGLTHLTGEGDGPPLLPSVALGDAVGAMSAVIGTMMALYWRDHGGNKGQHIDASLYEPILHATSQAIGRWKPGAPPRRSGSRLPSSAIRNVYATADGKHVVISASTERHVKELLEMAGGGTVADADAVVARWVGGLPLADVVKRMIDARIPVAPVNDLDMLMVDEHIAARQSLVRAHDPVLGEYALVTPSPRLTETPGTIRSTGPALAEHNADVYRDLLAMSDDRMAALKASGVI